MLSSKRRSTLNATSIKSKLESLFALSQRRVPKLNELIAKKYYAPVVQEEEQHIAFLITKYISGIRTEDQLGLGEMLKKYGEVELLAESYEKPQMFLKKIISNVLAKQNEYSKAHKRCLMHFYSFAFYLLLEKQRMLRSFAIKQTFTKKQTQKSTNFTLKKEANILRQYFEFSSEQNQIINESHELNKLSKCLKGMLKKHEKSRSYKLFLEYMEKQKNAESKKQPQRMLDLIFELEKDISSIHQQQPLIEHFSKEGIYGLSELKKKSDRKQSKMQPNKCKDKRLSTKYALCKMEFIRKPKELEPASKASSNSKNSAKSTSLRNKKCSKTNTPDHHHSKSKSIKLKKALKPTTEFKPKLVDTQRLYFDEGPEKFQEKQESKNSLVHSYIRKAQPQSSRCKKKSAKR